MTIVRLAVTFERLLDPPPGHCTLIVCATDAAPRPKCRSIVDGSALRPGRGVGGADDQRAVAGRGIEQSLECDGQSDDCHLSTGPAGGPEWRRNDRRGGRSA